MYAANSNVIMTGSFESTGVNEITRTQQKAPLLAAVEVEPGFPALADQAVDSVITSLQARGLNMVGLRQRIIKAAGEGCGVRLQSIRSGAFHKMTQDLGSGSTSCNIDSEALEQLALMLKTEVQPGVDLVIVNRFGKRESQGGGFCVVFERAIELGIPVLTMVNSTHLSSWREYGGDYVTIVGANEKDILGWVHTHVQYHQSYRRTGTHDTL